jgi:hypothetical protein
VVFGECDGVVINVLIRLNRPAGRRLLSIRSDTLDRGVESLMKWSILEPQNAPHHQQAPIQVDQLSQSP